VSLVVHRSERRTWIGRRRRRGRISAYQRGGPPGKPTSVDLARVACTLVGVKKILGIGIALIVVGVLGVGIWLYSSLDQLVARAIETFGSEAVGTQVRVGAVELDLAQGRGTIRRLSVANPEGFADASLLRFDELTLQVEPSSVTEAVVVVPEIRLIGARVVVEAREDGTTNLDVLRRNLGSGDTGGKGERPAEAAQESEPVRMRIGSLRMERGSLVFGLPDDEEPPKELDLPGFELRNLGGKNGASPDVLAREIAESRTRRIARSAAEQRIRKAIEDEIDDRLDGPEGEAVKGLLRSLTGGDSD